MTLQLFLTLISRIITSKVYYYLIFYTNHILRGETISKGCAFIFQNQTSHLHFRIIRSWLKRKHIIEIRPEHELPLLANKSTLINNS